MNLEIPDTLFVNGKPMNEQLQRRVKEYIRKGGYDGLDSEQEVAQIAQHFYNLALEDVVEELINRCDKIFKQGDESVVEVKKIMAYQDIMDFIEKLSK